MGSHSKAAGRFTEQLSSGNHRLVCDDCGDVIIAATEDEALDTPCRCHQLRQPLRYVYVLELTCSLCSRPIATVTLPSPTARLVLLRPVRCQTCGGVAIAGESPQRHQLPEAPFPIAKPRRGRPPVALRRPRIEESA
jgi:hypothetical protein